MNEDFPAGLTQEQKQSKGLHILYCRCRNTGADGINLCCGTTNALIEHVNCRGNGDDSFAIWSENDGWVASSTVNAGGCQGNVIRFCTAELPWRANGIGLYGGKNNRIEDVIVRDVLTYHGIMVDSQTFPSVTASGQVTIERVTLLRTSGVFWGGAMWPAIGIYANGDQKVVMNDLEILDTWYGVFRFEGTSNNIFTNFKIEGYLQYDEEDQTYGTYIMGFIAPFGQGHSYFENVVQSGNGGKGEGFFGNKQSMDKGVYEVGPGCNFDNNGPL